MIDIKEYRTEHLLVTPVGVEHSDAVFQVLEENRPVLEVLSSEVSIQDATTELINYADIPPGGCSDNIRAHLLSDLSTGDLVGIQSHYIGFPNEHTVYIGNLFLRPIWRYKGLGTELVNFLHRDFLLHGYRESKVLVGLKNWPALRFWACRDYRCVGNFKGDDEYGEGRFCSVELVCNLNFIGQSGSRFFA